MIEGDVGLDACNQQRLEHPRVEVQPHLVDLAIAVWQDARPGDGHAEALHSQQPHGRDVVEVAVIEIVCNSACA